MREFSASLVTPRRQYKRRDLFRVPRGLNEETEFCITPSRTGAEWRGEGSNRGVRFADDDNGAEVSFAKSCSGTRARSYFILRIPACETSIASPSVANLDNAIAISANKQFDFDYRPETPF